MKRRIQVVLLLVAVGYYVGCAPVKFDKDTNCGVSCVTINGIKTYRYSITPNAGKVDILFVDDNSASMSTEQRAIATRFSSFLTTLDSENIDYRIAITTTDIVKTAGQLIPFGAGVSFLTPSTPDKTTLFANTIYRKETTDCEAFLAANPSGAQSSSTYSQNCPSPDERGIYAANLTIQNNPGGFIRSDAHLAIVFIGDEDERSQLYDKEGADAFRLDTMDLPQTLISNVQSLFSGKSVSAHAIIVKPGSLNGMTAAQAADRVATEVGAYNPSNASAVLFNGGDTTCLNTQNHQVNGVSGSFGYLYALAARLTGGVEVDICFSDYASQLTTIGQNIGEQVSGHTMNCANPTAIDSSTPIVTFTPAGGATYDLVGDKMTFSPNLPSGTQAYLQYTCPD